MVGYQHKIELDRLSRLQKDGIVWVLLAVVYFLNKSPFWGWNDALGFGADAVSGWSPYTNATSHFLYTNVLHILLKVFVFLDEAWVATTFSVVCGLITAWQIKRIASSAGASEWSARCLMVVWSLSFTFWQQSESVEVYAFNCLIASQVLLWSIRDFVQDERKNWLAVACFMGLGLLTHIQWILALPFYGFYLFSRPKLKPLHRLLAIFLTGSMASLLFILPIATGKNTLSAVFFDNHFQDDVLGFQWVDLAKGLLKGVAYFLYNFHFFVVLVVWGWWWMFREKWALRWPLLLFSLPFWGFASKYGVSDNHVFYLVAYMPVLLPSARMLDGWLEGKGWMKRLVLLYAFIFPFLLYGLTTLMVRQTDFGKKYDAEKAYKGGVTHICWPGRSWAKDPLVMAKHYLDEDPEAFERGAIEWNYPDAVRLLGARDR